MSAVIHKMDQYSDEWWELRAGRMTASLASKLLTPTGKPSTQFRGELGRLVAEKLGFQEVERSDFSTEWMDRGTELEDEALRWLAVELDVQPERIGMITDGSDVIGASPDAVIFEDATQIIPVELKVPKPSTHIQWLLDGGLPKEHRAQVHFQMALTESPYAIFMSYHPEIRPLVITVEADDYTEAMHDAIDAFKKAYKDAILMFEDDDR